MFTCYEQLEQDNSKPFWTVHKTVGDKHVRDPMRALLDEFGPLRMSRPNHDMRFSKDKSPYKLFVGATSESRAVGGIGYYIELSATRLITGFGAKLMTRGQLQRFRSAINNEASGEAFEDVLATLAARSLPATHGAEPPLRKVPPGYPSAHPRGVAALEGRGHRARVRQGGLDAHHSRAQRHWRYLARQSRRQDCAARGRLTVRMRPRRRPARPEALVNV